MSWTEVVLQGNRESDSEIKVTGLFAHQDSFGKLLLNDADLSAMEKARDNLKVPMLIFPPPKGEFVVKVKFDGKRSKDLFTDWGPQAISFDQTPAEIAALFEQAKKNNKWVMLLDGRGGTYNVPPTFLEGDWFTKKFELVKNAIGTGYESQIVTVPAADADAAVPRIELSYAKP